MDAVKVSAELPFDVIAEILSWLPIKSLLRFRSVCEQWCFLIQDHQFIARHMLQASPILLPCAYIKREAYKSEILLDENFKFLDHCCGLFLEMSLTSSRVCRIRNPTTQQVVYLPDAQETTQRMNFAFNAFTRECKVVSVYRRDTGIGFEIITVGTDERWRPLKHPNQDWIKNQGKRILNQKYFGGTDKADGVVHFSALTTDEKDLCLEIQSLDIWTEHITTSTLPRGSFLDLNKVSVFRWDEFVAVGDITEEEINMLVLEDFKRHKWSRDKIIVSLKFLKDNPELKDQFFPGGAKSGLLRMFDNNQSRIIYYDMIKQKTNIYALPCKNNSYLRSVRHKPSLIALKGMKSENPGVLRLSLIGS